MLANGDDRSQTRDALLPATGQPTEPQTHRQSLLSSGSAPLDSAMPASRAAVEAPGSRNTQVPPTAHRCERHVARLCSHAYPVASNVANRHVIRSATAHASTDS